MRAARLGGAAEARREALAAPMLAPGRTRYERCLAGARARLGEAAWAAAWVAGRALPPDEAVALALAPEHAPEATPTPPLTAATPRLPHPADLTAREVAVLRLVAEGMTDAEVAARLHRSRRTVHHHLRAIYAKLEVGTRTAAARVARERGLA